MYPSVETHYPGLSQAVWVFPSLLQLLCHLLSYPTTDDPQGIHKQQGPNSCSGHNSLLPSTPRAVLIIAHSPEGRSPFIRLSQLHKVCLPRTQPSLGSPPPRPRLPSQSWTCSYPGWQCNKLVGQGHYRTTRFNTCHCFLILGHRGWKAKTKVPTPDI